MPIVVNLDVMMAKRKMSLNELSEKVELTLSNLSILKTGKAKAIRLPRWKLFAKFWIASRVTFWNTRTTMTHEILPTDQASGTGWPEIIPDEHRGAKKHISGKVACNFSNFEQKQKSPVYVI